MRSAAARACSPPASAARGSTTPAAMSRCSASLDGVPPERRTARYRAVIALSEPGGREAVTEGVVEGILLTAAARRRRLRLRSALLLPAARRHLRRGSGRGQARREPPRARDGAGPAHPHEVAPARVDECLADVPIQALDVGRGPADRRPTAAGPSSSEPSAETSHVPRPQRATGPARPESASSPACSVRRRTCSLPLSLVSLVKSALTEDRIHDARSGAQRLDAEVGVALGGDATGSP